ncbi:MAG TPA: trypsin-like peptidase domain-containing protein [Candidatus Paceibacterota bacterium]|nr:trypsin-like peptidase domain-containing protein [Candidatus Paceibacterota bacterium]
MFTQEQKIIKIIEKTLPAIVSISAFKKVADIEKNSPQWLYPLFEGAGNKINALRKKVSGKKINLGGGSGFIADASGIVITNVHVIVQNHLEYVVSLYDGRKLPAVLIGSDDVNDVAFLKIKADTNFASIALGDSSKIKLGQSVLAVGNALGLFANTVSAGIISGLMRSIQANNEILKENLRGLIQTDAAINPGNSGGPLIDMNGNVIGVNAASVTQAENIGFAVPINVAKKDLEQIKKYGRITRPLLGVRYITIDERVKEVLKLPVNWGALTTGATASQPAIIKNSPADKAGIKERDIILEIDGVKLTPQFALQDFLETAKIGQQISLKILRGKKEIQTRATLIERF